MTVPDGTKYFLRFTPEEKSASREDMFQIQKQIAALEVPMCRPVEFGRCEQGVYSIQTWIDGRDAGQVIPHLSEPEQYAYGLKAGRILQKIHSIPAPKDQPDWEPRFNKKMDRKIKLYRECPVHFEGAENFIAYIEENRRLLAGRPQSFQHGDYHIGNMMLEKGELVIIDFGRYDFGDPWEEFNRIVWCAQVSPRFASGMVDGYFNGDVPMGFWKLLALYISSNTLSSVPWAIPFGEEQIKIMLDQAKEVLGWYDNMKKIVPTWYSRNRE